MKIMYVAKHDSGGNDDEGSITYALQMLGHDVKCIKEFVASKNPTYLVKQREGILLFHKWLDTEILSQIKIPKVFWYFDLVDFKEPSMEYLSSVRRAWMGLASKLVDLGFCTDGDWVNQDTTGKLIKLTQGADERISKRYKRGKTYSPIMFSGSVTWGGTERKTFMADIRKAFGNKFSHITSEYRESLARHIAGSEIVVAPDTPSTDNYWSNRVYLTLGFGGLLLHPYCKALTEHYKDRKEIVYYHDRQELLAEIDYYLKHPEERKAIQGAALERTLRNHTYTHRCETLIKTVQERLDVR